MFKVRHRILGVWIILLFGAGGGLAWAQNAVSFAERVNYPVGTRPVAVAVGDFNGDAFLDLAVANDGSNNVSILLGNGDGTFRSAASVAVGRNPRSIAVGDFDGDGNMDLVVANAGTPEMIETTVSVAKGNGDGTFQAATAIEVGRTPFAVAVGDFNNDGRADFVVAKLNWTGPGSLGNISCRLGKPDFTFDAGSTIDVGQAPTSVIVADFNRDGKLDYAVTNSLSDNVNVWLGYGDGWFRPGHNFITGDVAPLALTVGDFNSDDIPDLAIAYLGSNKMAVWLGNGDGWFRPGQTVAVGESPMSVIAADLNGDNNQDLIVANVGSLNNSNGPSGANVSIFLGQGGGMFGDRQLIETENNPIALAYGDFDGDGKPDLVVVNWGANTVSVLINNTP